MTPGLWLILVVSLPVLVIVARPCLADEAKADEAEREERWYGHESN